MARSRSSGRPRRCRRADEVATAATQWMIWAFKLHGCAVCGRKPVEAGGDLAMADLHCHHRDPATKRPKAKGGIGIRGDAGNHMLGGARGRAAMLAELALCDVLCEKHHHA